MVVKSWEAVKRFAPTGRRPVATGGAQPALRGRSGTRGRNDETRAAPAGAEESKKVLTLPPRHRRECPRPHDKLSRHRPSVDSRLANSIAHQGRVQASPRPDARVVERSTAWTTAQWGCRRRLPKNERNSMIQYLKGPSFGWTSPGAHTMPLLHQIAPEGSTIKAGKVVMYDIFLPVDDPRRVGQLELANMPAPSFHPCHMLRRRSGRRCLWRITAGMPNRLPQRHHTRGQLQRARHTAASRSPRSSAPSPPLRDRFPRPQRPPMCAHHAKEPSLCALLIPFPRSPLAFPKIHVILPHRPAHQAWRPVSGVPLTVV